MQPKLILIVDDDPDVRRTLAALLSPEFSVLEARDGHDGLRVLAERSPALAIVDLDMPGMGGLEFLQCARRARGGTVFIMLTGSSEQDSIVAALTAGVATYITKPWEPEQLREEIRRQLASAEPRQASGSPWRIER